MSFFNPVVGAASAVWKGPSPTPPAASKLTVPPEWEDWVELVHDHVRMCLEICPRGQPLSPLRTVDNDTAHNYPSLVSHIVEEAAKEEIRTKIIKGYKLLSPVEREVVLTKLEEVERNE